VVSGRAVGAGTSETSLRNRPIARQLVSASALRSKMRKALLCIDCLQCRLGGWESFCAVWKSISVSNLVLLLHAPLVCVRGVCCHDLLHRPLPI
jgi:hypothetical protein